MEHELRCNQLACRRLLGIADGAAIVTTCSHIFCVTCAEASFADRRLCPACETNLPEADDIVHTSLNPSQSFKSTILAGMDPMTIHDICGRALGFWTYQVAQENTFQQMVLKDAQERTSVMERDVANIVREANTKVMSLEDKIREMQRELETATRRNRELSEMNKESTKEYNKLRQQYEKYMGKHIGGQRGAAILSSKIDRANSSAVGIAGLHHMAPAPSFVQSTPMRSFQPALASGQSSNASGRRTFPVNTLQPRQPQPAQSSSNPQRTGSLTAMPLRGSVKVNTHSDRVDSAQLARPMASGPGSRIAGERDRYQHPAPDARSKLYRRQADFPEGELPRAASNIFM